MSVAGVAVSAVIVILAFFIFFETEGTATTEAEVAAAMDAGNTHFESSVMLLVSAQNLIGKRVPSGAVSNSLLVTFR